jgi:AraC family transcriptional regulator of adaptative response/methylated-DNA-[protein]-cysteine methyltransferase
MNQHRKAAEYYQIVARVIEYIDSVFPEQPDLIELALVAGLSESIFTGFFRNGSDFLQKNTCNFCAKSMRKGFCWRAVHCWMLRMS